MNKTRAPWPTKDAMIQVYEKKLWGGSNNEFYSGEGSHKPELVNPYVEVVQSFLKSFQRPIKVCDLGCGDFNVGRQLFPLCEEYVAVDIVPKLIARNRETFQAENLEFRCLDIVQDEWPTADCIILRQVLQHLSNREVKRVVEKLPKHKYLILTEHLPDGNFEPNVDMISGQGIRLKKGSGLDLLKAPFGLKVIEERALLSLKPSNNKGVIVTRLYRFH